jgi:hypothetical protein
MKRTLVLALLTLAALAGVASADRHRRDRDHDRGHDRDRDRDRGRWHRGPTWSGGVSVKPARVVIRPRVVVQPRHTHVHRTHVVRRPVFVQAPQVRVRYYNYYQRPVVLAENYAPMTGYYWVNGSWGWNGYEWIWTAGHYEPDPSYIEPGYHDPSCEHDRY